VQSSTDYTVSTQPIGAMIRPGVATMHFAEPAIGPRRLLWETAAAEPPRLCCAGGEQVVEPRLR
jgi:hypothetical protein